MKFIKQYLVFLLLALCLATPVLGVDRTFNGDITGNAATVTNLTVESTAAVDQDLTQDASPTFVTGKFTGLTDLKIPKHVSDTSGLADTTVTVSANNEVTNASQPSFLARPSADVLDQTGDGTTYTVIFNTEIFDQGGDYDTSTGIFTAPVTGKYNLSSCINAYSGTADHANWQSYIVTSNRSYGDVLITAAASNPFTSYSAKMAVLADMDAADTVYVTFRVTGGTKVVDFDTGSFFSGYLAH